MDEQTSRHDGYPQSEVEALAASIKAIDEHVANPSALEEDILLRGSPPLTLSIIYLVLLAVCLCAALAIFLFKDSNVRITMWAITGVIAFMILIVSFISLCTDYVATHIHNANTAKKAFKRFFKSARAFRTKQLFSVLVPTARRVDSVRSLDLENIPMGIEPPGFSDPRSLKKYWKYVYCGPSGHTRSVRIKKVKQVADLPGDVAVIEATMIFDSQSSGSLVFGLMGLPVGSKREKAPFHKILVKRNNCWYFLSGELEGDVDRLAARL